MTEYTTMEERLTASVYRMFGAFLNQPRVNFGSAHYNYDPRVDFPLLKSVQIGKIIDAIQSGKPIDFLGKLGINPPEEVIREIILDETSLRPAVHQISPVYASTRFVIQLVLTELVNSSRKRVALPTPNWHFWSLGHPDWFVHFDAFNEEQLVEGFRSEVDYGDIGSVLLSFPATPLMYTPSDDALREMNRIASKSGVNVIVDDVLRGVQPIGQRDSIARFFDSPYVIEGFSKRFGVTMGDLSYILSPDSKLIRVPVNEGSALISSLVLDHCYRNHTKKAIEELRERNVAFDNGLSQYAPIGTEVLRPSPTHLTSLIRLPSDLSYCDSEVAEALNNQLGICTAPLSRFLADPNRRHTHHPALRITVGQMDKDEIYSGAFELGQCIGKIYESR